MNVRVAIEFNTSSGGPSNQIFTVPYPLFALTTVGRGLVFIFVFNSLKIRFFVLVCP